MMRLACQERLLPGDTVVERWDNARRAGYDGIELHGPPDFALRDRLPELRRAAAEGVVFSSVCVAMRHFIGDFDAERRADAVANLSFQLSVIAELGGVGVVTPAAYGMYTRKLPPFRPPPRTEDEDVEVLVDALTELGQHAAAEGVDCPPGAAQPVRGPHGQPPRPGRCRVPRGRVSTPSSSSPTRTT